MSVRRLIAAWTAVACLAAAPGATQQTGLDPRIKPGQSFVVPFPGLPKTLANAPSELHIYIPKKYDLSRKHPLFVWLNGGAGGPGIRTGPVGEDHFVVVSMPLYKVNPAAGLLLTAEDSGLIWSCHKQMLAEVERLVPNISPELRVIGGFSNGANCQAVLLNRVREFADAFKGFLLWEGGNMLDNFKVLSGKSLFVLYGQNSLGKYGAPIAASAQKAGADAEFFEMKGVGHDAPASFDPKVHDWIDRKVIYRDLPDAFRAMNASLGRSRWAEAVSLYNRVSAMLLDESREEFPKTQEAHQKLCLAAQDAAAKLPGSEPTKQTITLWKKFVSDWSPCPPTDKIRSACSAFGEAELKDVLLEAETGRARALRKFLDEWSGYAVRASAIAALEELAGKELGTLMEKHKGPALLGPLQKFTHDYTFTPSAQKALDRIQDIREDQASTLLAQIKQMSNAADRKRAAQDLIRNYDGTRAAIEAREIR
jgi:hypothetical protein